MQRSRHLFRDFGLTLALVLAAVLVYWRTTLPSLRKNYRLDEARNAQLDEQERLRAELTRLRQSEQAAADPIEIERVQRAQHGALGLPKNERPLPAEAEASAEPSAPSRDRRGGSRRSSRSSRSPPRASPRRRSSSPKSTTSTTRPTSATSPSRRASPSIAPRSTGRRAARRRRGAR